MVRIIGYISKFAAAALDLVLPPLEPCTLCREPLSIHSEVRVCQACLDRLGRIGDARCGRCGRALAPARARARREALCHQCRAVPSALDAARAYSTYDG